MLVSIKLDFDSEIPLFKQVVNLIKQQIETGETPPGTKLPSTRQLAIKLQISRSTTTAAFKELYRLGLIEHSSHAGTFVAKKTFENKCNDQPSPLLDFAIDDGHSQLPLFSQMAEIHIAETKQQNCFKQFEKIVNLPQHFLPAQKWHSLLIRNHKQRDSFKYFDESCTENKLKQSLAGYLERARGFRAHPDHIVVFGNLRQALNALGSLFLNQGDTVAIEAPCNPTVRSLFLAKEANLAHIAVDTNGMMIRQLNDQAEEVKLIYTKPGNQMPFGISLSMERREELLNYSQQHNALIVEDDCDHEFIYGHGHSPALKALDKQNQVIYISSFSTCLHPLTEIAYIVVPAAVAESLVCIRKFLGGCASKSEQNILAEILDDGFLERHLVSLRSCFSNRRSKLIEHLAHRFGTSVFLFAGGAATNICARFNDVYPLGHLAQAAHNAGLPACDASDFMTGPAGLQHLLISIPHLDEETLATSVVRFSDELNHFDGFLQTPQMVAIP